MLYVGHFSFVSPEKEKESDAFTVESKGGTFSCLVEADSLDGAADKFGDLIKVWRPHNHPRRLVRNFWVGRCCLY
jgi:hypothetical protein